MKKLLFVYHTSSIGGGSYCLLNILKCLNRKQITPIVVLRNNGPLVEEIKNLGIEVYFLKNLRTVPYNKSLCLPSSVISIYHLFRSLRAFRLLLQKIQPDVVYLNSMMLYPYLRVVKSEGLKSIIHIREHWPEGQHSIQRTVALKCISRTADSIIAINRYSASMFAKYCREVPIVYDWIDMKDRFDGTNLNDLFEEDVSKKKVFLYIGGMQEIKGAFEVVSLFHHNCTSEEDRLLILGIDPSYHSSGMKEFIKRMLSLVGMKTYSQKVLEIINDDKRIKCIRGKYQIGDIFSQVYCILSYFTIPHANLALAESIICGGVNIAARNDESLEYSLDGELAVLFEANNMDSFHDALLSIDDKRDAIIEKIKNRSHIVESMFDPLINSKRLNEIIASLAY